MKHGFVNTKNHGRVHYLEAGEGPVLVLLHSNGASAFQYEQVLPDWGHFSMIGDPELFIREVNRLTR